ncbi:MAG: hypothetical protein JWO31_596 [Phycisphaerales bacterium]|nr:hypothetical protein [Phycisphaerales bacterium]
MPQFYQRPTRNRPEDGPRSRPGSRELADDLWTLLAPVVCPLDVGPRRPSDARLNKMLADPDAAPAGARRWLRHLPDHLKGGSPLDYTLQRDAWRVLLCISADGAPDAGAALARLVGEAFAGAYVEADGDRHREYIMVDPGPLALDPSAFNALADRAQRALAARAWALGFRGEVALRGRHNVLNGPGTRVVNRAVPAPVPRLPAGRADIDRLRRSPLFTLEDLERVADGRACATLVEAGTTPVRWDTPGAGETPEPNMTRVKSRSTNGDRRARARRTTKRRCLPSRAGEMLTQDWVGQRDALVRAVEAHCGPKAFRVERVVRTTGEVVVDDWTGRLRPEALAVVLFVVTKGSFVRRAYAVDQWTAGVESIRGAFGGLKAARAYQGPIPGTPGLVAAKRVLERAGLIACVDRTYNARAAGGRGVSKKYSVGPSHPRYAEFVEWSAGVEVERADAYRARLKAGQVGAPAESVPVAPVPVAAPVAREAQPQGPSILERYAAAWAALPPSTFDGHPADRVERCRGVCRLAWVVGRMGDGPPDALAAEASKWLSKWAAADGDGLRPAA